MGSGAGRKNQVTDVGRKPAFGTSSQAGKVELA